VQALISGTFATRAAAFAAARAIAQTSLCCSAVLVEGAGSPLEWRALVVAEGFRGAVARQVVEARRSVELHQGSAQVYDDARATTDVLQALAARRAAPPERGGVLLRGTVMPARQAPLVADLLDVLAPCFDATYLQADAAVGTFYLAIVPWGDDAAPIDLQIATLARARAQLRAAEGHLVVEAAPSEIRRGMDPWGAPAAGEQLARMLKRHLDPAGILNPGRFAYGI
jgi:FAD/FMN-containing dehydrogenase